MDKAKYLIKNIGIFTLSNFVSRILIFFLLPLYTFVLSTSDYGYYDISISTVTLLFPILTFNIVDAVNRFLMDPNYSKNKIAIVGVSLISSSILLFISCICMMNSFLSLNYIDEFKYYILLYYFFYAFNQFFNQFSKGLERVKDMGIAGVLSTLFIVFCNVMFLLVFKLGIRGLFVANIIGQAISAIFLAFRLKIWLIFTCFKIDKLLAKEMIFYSMPLMVCVLGWWINSTIDRVVIAYMLGFSSNGIISVAYKIPQIINTVQSVFIQAWQISAIKEYGDRHTSNFYEEIFGIVNILMCLVCSSLILLNRPIAYMIYAKDFVQSWQFVPPLLLASVLNCASGLLGAILSAKKNSKAMMWSALIGGGLNVILSIFLVGFIGIQGATIATVLSSFVIYVVRKGAVGNDIVFNNHNVVLATWVLLCIQAIVAICLKSYIIEITIFVAIIFINIDVINKIIKNGKRWITNNI